MRGKGEMREERQERKAEQTLGVVTIRDRLQQNTTHLFPPSPSLPLLGLIFYFFLSLYVMPFSEWYFVLHCSYCVERKKKKKKRRE